MPERDDFHGALFSMGRKEKPSHPDYTGDALLGGIKYRLAGWHRTSKAGTKYIAISFSAMSPNEIPYHAPQSAYPVAKPPLDDLDDDEDIPL